MKTKFFTAILITSLLFITACNKDTESLENSCERLSSGLVNNNSTDAGNAVNQIINRLGSTEYSVDNLNALAQKINTNCGITADLTCLNCIHGFPFASEITVNFPSGGQSRQKILVITHTTANKMIFGYMHD
jgi:hypothetical protein